MELPTPFDTRIYNEIINSLKKQYPDNVISHLNKVNPKLYSKVRKIAKELGLSPSEYCKQLGFEVINGRQTTRAVASYDIQTMRKLLDEFDINEARLAAILNCSRQNINDKLKRNSSNADGTWLMLLDSNEESQICNQIQEMKDTEIGDKFSFSLLTSRENPYKKALIFREGTTVKVAFELPATIENALQTNNLDIFTAKELQIVDMLESIWIAQGSQKSNGQKRIYLDANQKIKIKSLAANHNMEFADYLDLQGFSYIDKRSVSDEDILEKISKYADKDRKIHLNSTDDDYFFFTSRASRTHQNIYQFFQSYGCHYERGHDVGDTFEKHRQIIEQRYKVDSNRIYISSYDPYYGTLSSFAVKNNLSLDKLIASFGFERIAHKKDLPTSYVPFDYTLELNKSDRLDEQNIAAALASICNENGEVYLDVTSYLYYILFLKAKAENTNITSIVQTFGYTRVFDRSRVENTVTQSDKADDFMRDAIHRFIVNKIRELKALESKYKVNISLQEGISRNKQLVIKMKELYQCKCQLCDPENPIPLICKDDGELYAEVHHITSIHEAQSDEDINYIDTYKNTLVLCPYHHKFVHLHHGGFKHLVLEDDIFYLENDRGERAQIFINYHL